MFIPSVVLILLAMQGQGSAAQCLSRTAPYHWVSCPAPQRNAVTFVGPVTGDCSNLKDRTCSETTTTTKLERVQPIDVPAIQEMRETGSAMWGSIDGQNLAWLCPNPDDKADERGSCHGLRWTCADKSRGLWESVDGHHWCRRAQP